MMSFDTVFTAQARPAAPRGTCCGADLDPSGCEPSLDEILADPIVRLVMKQDGVTELSIRRLMARLEIARSQPTYGVWS